ncbi:methyltransferase domain-containing protein [Lentzea indica]|uniref:methyltransferase domain-containing protein n=1 Tax=Lentzea indica TaxID=2604800 RepID=UPI0028AD21DF|nr:methyltransferase domain-containing protein [Lentzea indica]
MSSHAELTAELTAAGALPAAWAETFSAVDRALFVPAHCWVDDYNGQPRPLDGATDHARWEAAVYSDVPIVTQLDDGKTVWPDTSRNATSSASQPTVVLAMLEALNITGDVANVLEIGTGTGYNAALLSHRLGDAQVTTVEVDQELAEQAQAALEAVGRKPTVVVGDGAEGYSANAPYDRIIATASVQAGHIPIAWVAQLRPRGELVTPWKSTWGSGVLVRLVSQGERTAVGPVVGDAFFMNLRDHRVPFGFAGKYGRIADEATGVPSFFSTVRPDEVALDRDGAFAVGLRLPGVQHSIAYDKEDGEAYELLLYDVDSDSWATVQVDGGSTALGEFEVRQQGPRALWTEAERAHAWWVESGCPERTRFGLTVTTDSQTAWLDRPGNIVATFE